MANPFVQFSLVILVVLVVSLIMKLLKQPLIIGYILSGILLGPSFLNLMSSSTIMGVFAEMGIAFLLFIVGLHLSPRVIEEVGKISVITGIGQIIFTSLIGFMIAILMGFDYVSSIYIAIALTFSSTIIIMKLLSDKEAFDMLYGKISVGFLLVQDIVAIIIMIFLSSLSQGGSVESLVFSILVKGLALTAFLIPVSLYILPKFSDFFADSQEFLFIFAIAWGLGLGSLFHYLGFSIEVGALIAGIVLSISPYSYEISSRLKPLRDFFIISFFLVLGSQMVFSEISQLIIPATIFSVFILFGNPLIVMILMGILGYSKKVGFNCGLTVAQISEFSLIMVAMGVKTGHLDQEILSFVTMIGLITIAGSTYMILYSEQIYKKIYKFLTLFERKKHIDEKTLENDYDYILFGYNRIGFSILNAFEKITDRYLVVDFDPERIEDLKKRNITYIYGDVEDSELLDKLDVHKAKVLVSTVPDKEVNKLINNKIKNYKKKPIYITTATQISEALELYEAGADYVILPHFLGGEYAANLILESKGKKNAYKREKKKELNILEQRKNLGHEHPKTLF